MREMKDGPLRDFVVLVVCFGWIFAGVVILGVMHGHPSLFGWTY